MVGKKSVADLNNWLKCSFGLLILFKRLLRKFTWSHVVASWDVDGTFFVLCLQEAAQPASWFWTGRVTSCTRPIWEIRVSWWSEEGRWFIAPMSSSTTSTHPSNCQSHPREPRGPCWVTGTTSAWMLVCRQDSVGVFVAEIRQCVCKSHAATRKA